jgi:ribosomal-protein-alanine N-acetyltransferase
MIRAVPLADDLVLRLLDAGDAAALAAAYVRNREHLAPWEPVREDAFFTEQGQAADVDAQLASAVSGASVPLTLEERVQEVVVERNGTDHSSILWSRAHPAG